MTTRTTAVETPVWIVDNSGHNGIDGGRLEDGEVKEMIIGVGNGQFMWAYGELNRSYPSSLVISVPMGAPASTLLSRHLATSWTSTLGAGSTLFAERRGYNRVRYCWNA